MAAPTEMLQLSLLLPLPSPTIARVALGALEPDLAPPPPPLPQQGRGHRGPSPTARAERRRETLRVQWEAPFARSLRGGASSFLELLGLVLETIESFGPGAGPQGADPAHNMAADSAPPTSE